MNALRSVATALTPARTLAHRMGAALRSMPRPRIDTRLAAEALGQIRTGIRTAVSQVTRAGTPPAAPTPNDASASPTARLNAYRALARLAGDPQQMRPAPGPRFSRMLSDLEPHELISYMPQESSVGGSATLAECATQPLTSNTYRHKITFANGPSNRPTQNRGRMRNLRHERT